MLEHVGRKVTSILVLVLASVLLLVIKDPPFQLGLDLQGGTRLVYSVDFEEGVADFLAGERGKGLELIARAAEDGFYIMPSEAYLQTLYDDPGFAPIMAGQEAQQARERDRFLLIVCNNNPYVDVWQPAEETCDRFAAEQRN